MMVPAYTFHGGVSLIRHKDALRRKPSRAIAPPSELVYPLCAHVGTPARPVVGIGQRVLKGEMLAAPDSYVSQAIHAATSGIIVEIGPRPVIHPAGLMDTAIVLKADGEDRAVAPWPALNSEDARPESLQARIVDAGIIGMGGAGFPSHVKLREGMTQSARLLIINGVECEPYIGCDDCVLRERTGDVIEGVRILMRALRTERCIVAVEEDMEDAAAALLPYAGAGIEVATVPAIYPAGGEKQLIRMLTGLEVPTHGLPILAGVVMHNVATALAVYEAVALGIPLTERMVTVAGAMREPVNMRVPVGTPLTHVLAACGSAPTGARLIVGGPMMGTAIASAAAPVGKTTNCMLVLDALAPAPEMPCIRCGECVEVCPAQLQPQALYEFARAGEWESAQDYHLFDCIECGVCAYVCPSRLPLVHFYRYAKSEIEALDELYRRTDELQRRYTERQQRLAHEGDIDVTNDDSGQQSVERPGTELHNRAALQAEIAAAIARVRAKRSKGGDPGAPTNGDGQA